MFTAATVFSALELGFIYALVAMALFLSFRILEALHVDYTHVMVDGKIVKTGDGSLVDQINETGFEEFLK